MKNTSLILKIFILIGTLIPSVVSSQSQEPLPAPNHSMFFGYYHVAAQYGNYLNEVSGYTNAQIILQESFLRASEPNPAAFAAAMQGTIDLGHTLIFAPSGGDQDTEWRVGLDAATPYWNDIDYVYLADEPVWDIPTTEAFIDAFNTELSQRGLARKRIIINFTPDQILNGNAFQANGIDVIGLEAYMDPSMQNSPNLVSSLNTQIDQMLNRVGNRKVMLIPQAYNRNGAWTNLNSLASIQEPVYLAAYDDPRVEGLLAFTYARPGGTRELTSLRTPHQRIASAILGIPVGDNNPPPGPVDTSPTAITGSSWSPAGGKGWYPQLSSDGRYVAYTTANTGNPATSNHVWVVDLQTNQSVDLTQSGFGGCWAPQWIQANTVTFFCDNSSRTAPNMARFEASAPSFSVTNMGNDPSLAGGNTFAAGDGHWGAWGFGRVAYDNAIVTSNNPGGNLDVSGTQLVHSCTNENTSICLYSNGQFSKEFQPQVTIRGISINDGYIVYGGMGPIRGIGPSGTDVNLTATAWQYESVGEAILVGGQPWIVSATYNSATNEGLILFREWGQRDSIILAARAVNISVAYDASTSEFVVAYNDETGNMGVARVSINSPRRDISGGIPPEGDVGGAGFGGILNVPVPATNMNFGQLIQFLITYSLYILGLAVFVMIFWAGFLWFTAAGDSGKVGQAKSRIYNAIIGAILLAASYVILNTINPELIGGDFFINAIPPRSSTNVPGAGSGN